MLVVVKIVGTLFSFLAQKDGAVTFYRETHVRITSEDGSPKTTKVTLEDGTLIEHVENIEIRFKAAHGTEAIIHCLLPSLDVLVPAEIRYRDQLINNLSHLTQQLIIDLYRDDAPAWLVRRREQLMDLLLGLQRAVSPDDFTEDALNDN